MHLFAPSGPRPCRLVSNPMDIVIGLWLKKVVPLNVGENFRNQLMSLFSTVREGGSFIFREM